MRMRRQPHMQDRMLDAGHLALPPLPADAFLSVADRLPCRPDFDVHVAAALQGVALASNAAHHRIVLGVELHGHLGEVAGGHPGIVIQG